MDIVHMPGVIGRSSEVPQQQAAVFLATICYARREECLAYQTYVDTKHGTNTARRDTQMTSVQGRESAQHNKTKTDEAILQPNTKLVLVFSMYVLSEQK